MKDKRFIEALDRLNIRDSQREELLGEILLRAEAEEREQKYMKKSRRSGRRGASPWRALAPIFAVVLIIGAVLLVPSVGEAVSGWFGRLFDRNKYLGTLPENRASMPDVEAAIQIPKDNEQDYTIYTLDETDEAAEFAAARANLGFDPYDPKDWQWLKEAKPKITDVLVESDKLTVMSYLETDPSPFWYCDGGMALDWYGDNLYLSSGANTYKLEFGSTGIYPQDGYYDSEKEKMDAERVKKDKGIILYTEYDLKETNVPEGHYSAVFTSRILDCKVDVMAQFATIAKIEQRFELDIDGRNTSKKERSSVQLSGKYPLTMLDHENDRIYNIEKELSGITVKPEAAFNATSIAVSVSYEFPEGWSEAEKSAFIYGYAGRYNGLHYEVMVDGESLGKDGKEPSNYRSYFGGSTWEPVPGTDKYYLHMFAKEQPDLNWNNPRLKKELFDMVNWWLEKGVAGFRIDAIINIKKDTAFPDYPADGADGLVSCTKMVEEVDGVGELLEELKKETFEKYGAFTVAEVFNMKEDELREFIGDDGHFSTMFDFSAAVCPARLSKACFRRAHLLKVSTQTSTSFADIFSGRFILRLWSLFYSGQF